MIIIGADDGADGHQGIATGTILDYHRLTPTLAGAITKQAGAEIYATAGSKGDDELDRALRPRLRSRWDDRKKKYHQRQSRSVNPLRASKTGHGGLLPCARIRYPAGV